MAREVVRRRGTTADHEGFTGALGETTIDTDKNTVVVHDGSTAGGFPLARESNANVFGELIHNIVVIFESVYAALDPKDPNTLYLVITATLSSPSTAHYVMTGYDSDFAIL